MIGLLKRDNAIEDYGCLRGNLNRRNKLGKKCIFRYEIEMLCLPDRIPMLQTKLSISSLQVALSM